MKTPTRFENTIWHDNGLSIVVLRGRRGATLHPPSFAWQAWHKLTSTLSRTHIIFHTQHLSHATFSHTYTYNYIHTFVPSYIHTYIHTYHFTFSIFHHLLCPSLSPLKPLKLILGRSWLVGVSGPLIFILTQGSVHFRFLPGATNMMV